MTRIIHVAAGREWRGGQRQTWLLARELQRLGVDQLLVTARDSELARRARADGVPVREVEWTMGIDPRAWWATRAEAAKGPVVLHAHDGHAVTIARWVADARTPWVVTRRNSSPLSSPAGWKSASRVVAISRAVATQLRKDGIPDDRIVVVPSGVDAEAIRTTPRESLREWAKIPPGMPVIVTVAAATEEKGLSTALAACGALKQGVPDLRWVVIGEGPLRTELRSRAKAHGSQDNFLLPGHHPEPARLLRDADLFVLPSLSEGLGTSVLDAMALDLPVVVSDAGGLPELVGSDAGLVVPAGDAEALAAAIDRMLADPELRRRSVEGGRRVVERFSARAMAEGMRAVYDSVVANH